MKQQTPQGVWHASRKALQQEINRVFQNATPQQQLFKLLAEYLIQNWLMYDPTIDSGSYVPVPVTWSKASASLGRLPARLPSGGALHVLESEGASWFDIKPQGKVVFVSLKLAPFQRSRGLQHVQQPVEPEIAMDTWQWSLADLHLLMEQLWPGESHESQFARTAVKFLVEEGTQEHVLANGSTCWVAIPIRLYTVIRATSHLQMDGEKRITLLLRLGGDNVVVRRGPDGEDKLLQLHMGQLTAAFRKHFPSKAKSIPRAGVAPSSSPSSGQSDGQTDTSPPPTPYTGPNSSSTFAAVAAGVAAAQAAAQAAAAVAQQAVASQEAASTVPSVGYAASRAASLRSLRSNCASPPAPEGLQYIQQPQQLTGFGSGLTDGQTAQIDAVTAAILGSCSPTGVNAAGTLPAHIRGPSGGQSGTHIISMFSSHVGSSASSLANSPPSNYGVPPSTLGLMGNGTHKTTSLQLANDFSLPLANGASNGTLPHRTLSQTSTSLFGGGSFSSPQTSLNPLQLPHTVTNSTSSFTSAYGGTPSGPATPDGAMYADAWLSRGSLGSLAQNGALGVPQGPPQLEVLHGSGPQQSLVQRLQNSGCSVCALGCETSGTGLSMQLALLMIYVAKPQPTCLLIDAADIIPGGWLHNELQNLLQHSGITKVVHDGQRITGALGTVQLALGPSTVDTRVMQAMLREMARQSGDGNLPIEAPRQLHKLLQQYGWSLESTGALASTLEDPAVWSLRPLPNKLVDHCSRELAMLPQLAGALQRDLVTLMGPWVAAASLVYSQGHAKDMFPQELLRCL